MKCRASTFRSFERVTASHEAKAHSHARRHFLKQAGVLAGLAASSQLVSSGVATAHRSNAHDLIVNSYASDPKDVDSVNTHWVETLSGLVIIDAQRLLPEAENVVRAIQKSARPVIAIFVTHAHSDHYGGLPVLRRAFPDAPIYATSTTIRTMREDTYGFNAARKKRHGVRFASQDDINGSLPDTPVAHGQSVVLSGLKLEIVELTSGEADSTAVVHIPEHKAIFPGDLVQGNKIPMPFHSHMTWLAQLDAMAHRIPRDTVAYQGHGAPASFHKLIDTTRAYLVTARDLVHSHLGESAELTDAAKQEIAFELTTRFPFHAPGGGNTRARVLNGLISRLSKQITAGDRAGPVFKT